MSVHSHDEPYSTDDDHDDEINEINNIPPITTLYQQGLQTIQDAISHDHDTPQYHTNQFRLSKYFRDLDERHPSLEKRRKFHQLGIYQLAIQVIKAKPQVHLETTIRDAWIFVSGAMFVNNSNNKREFEAVHQGIELGLIELAADELMKYSPYRFEGRMLNPAFLCLTCASVQSENVSRVLNSGVIPICCDIIKKADMSDRIRRGILSDSLRMFNWCAMSQPQILQNIDGLFDAAIGILPLLTTNDIDDVIIIGFQASRLLIRTLPPEDCAKVIIHEHPAVLQFYEECMERILKSGKSNGYFAYNTFWSFAGLVFDLYRLSLAIHATNRNNNHILSPLISKVVEILNVSETDNYDVFLYGIAFLAEIRHDNGYHEILQVQCREGLLKLYKVLLAECSSPFYVETIGLLGDVVGSIV
jgi:hypothetical protein